MPLGTVFFVPRTMNRAAWEKLRMYCPELVFWPAFMQFVPFDQECGILDLVRTEGKR